MDSLQASRIAGGNSAIGRRESDFYPTPPEVTVALLDFLRLPENTVIWEPAAGEGDMAGVLQTYFETVYTTDILDGTDFFFKDGHGGSPLMDVMWCVWLMPHIKGTQTVYRPLERPKGEIET